MTTFTMRYVNGHFVVVGPNISLMRFKSRAEGKTRIIADRQLKRSALTA